MVRGSKGWLLGLSGVALIGIAVTLGSPGLIPLGGAASRAQASNPGAEKIVASVLAQLGTKYQPGYFAIDYPNGDIPIGQGVCTDVVIRSLRGARRDIQQLMHEDMKKRFGEYPTRYGLTKPIGISTTVACQIRLSLWKSSRRSYQPTQAMAAIGCLAISFTGR